jgi:hypothetical protein
MNLLHPNALTNDLRELLVRIQERLEARSINAFRTASVHNDPTSQAEARGAAQAFELALADVRKLAGLRETP